MKKIGFGLAAFLCLAITVGVGKNDKVNWIFTVILLLLGLGLAFQMIPKEPKFLRGAATWLFFIFFATIMFKNAEPYLKAAWKQLELTNYALGERVDQTDLDMARKTFPKETTGVGTELYSYGIAKRNRAQEVVKKRLTDNSVKWKQENATLEDFLSEDVTKKETKTLDLVRSLDENLQPFIKGPSYSIDKKPSSIQKAAKKNGFLCRRQLPHTQVSEPTEGILSVSIDGTNEFDSENPKIHRNGHPVIPIPKGAVVEIEWIDGKISPNVWGIGKFDPWGAVNCREKLSPGEKIRYYDLAHWAIIPKLVLSDGSEKLFPFKLGTRKVTINAPAETTLFLFYNTKEYYQNQHGIVEDGLPYVGYDGERAEFEIQIFTSQQKQLKPPENSFSERVNKRVQEGIESIKNQTYSLKGFTLDLKEALRYASHVASLTGIRDIFLLAVLKQESNWGSELGEGNWQEDMSPNHHQAFLQITTELDLDPNKIPVSKKPTSYPGWGGAMGPAQFMPNTWLEYKEKISQITDHNPPSPWNLEDAFVGAGLKLAQDGANKKTPAAEWKAAMVYFAGENYNNPIFQFFGDGVMELAEILQKQKTNQ